MKFGTPRREFYARGNVFMIVDLSKPSVKFMLRLGATGWSPLRLLFFILLPAWG